MLERLLRRQTGGSMARLLQRAVGLGVSARRVVVGEQILSQKKNMLAANKA